MMISVFFLLPPSKLATYNLKKIKAVPVPLVFIDAQGLASHNRCDILQFSVHSQHLRYPAENHLPVL